MLQGQQHKSQWRVWYVGKQAPGRLADPHQQHSHGDVADALPGHEWHVVMRHRVCAGNRCCVRHINHSADVMMENMYGFHEIADKVHHACEEIPRLQTGVQMVCMGAPSSSATARQGVMRSADVCDSRALRQVLSASRCEGPADAAPQRDAPQPEPRVHHSQVPDSECVPLIF